jgi:hypothetical protein
MSLSAIQHLLIRGKGGKMEGGNKQKMRVTERLIQKGESEVKQGNGT